MFSISVPVCVGKNWNPNVEKRYIAYLSCGCQEVKDCHYGYGDTQEEAVEDLRKNFL